MWEFTFETNYHPSTESNESSQEEYGSYENTLLIREAFASTYPSGCRRPSGSHRISFYRKRTNLINQDRMARQTPSTSSTFPQRRNRPKDSFFWPNNQRSKHKPRTPVHHRRSMYLSNRHIHHWSFGCHLNPFASSWTRNCTFSSPATSAVAAADSTRVRTENCNQLDLNKWLKVIRYWKLLAATLGRRRPVGFDGSLSVPVMDTSKQTIAVVPSGAQPSFQIRPEGGEWQV